MTGCLFYFKNINYLVCHILTSVCFLATPNIAQAAEIVPQPLEIIQVVDGAKSDIKYKVDQFGLKNGLSLEMLNYLVDGESGYDPKSLGDLDITCKRTGKPVYARGLLQWTRCFHPEISDDHAFDPDISLELALPSLRDKATCMKEWTVCRKYYQSKK